jgi:hypothetical protein
MYSISVTSNQAGIQFIDYCNYRLKGTRVLHYLLKLAVAEASK